MQCPRLHRATSSHQCLCSKGTALLVLCHFIHHLHTYYLHRESASLFLPLPTRSTFTTASDGIYPIRIGRPGRTNQQYVLTDACTRLRTDWLLLSPTFQVIENIQLHAMTDVIVNAGFSGVDFEAAHLSIASDQSAHLSAQNR